MYRRFQLPLLLGLACLAVAGFGGVAGLVLRHAEEPEEVVQARRERLDLEADLYALRVQLWELGAVAASEEAATFEDRLHVTGRILLERADALLVRRDLPGLRTVRALGTQAKDAGFGFEQLSREAPEAAVLIRREFVRLVGDADRLLATDIERVHGSTRQERVVEAFRRQGLGLAVWLFALPVAAVLGIVWVGRHAPLGNPAAARPASAEPPAEADGLAFLEKTFQAGADPVLNATSVDNAPIPQAMLQPLLETAKWTVLVLDHLPTGGEPAVVWASKDTGVLAASGITAPIGQSLPALFPSQADALRAALASTTPGTSRRSEFDLGARGKPRVCEMIAVHPGEGPPGRMLVAIKPIDGERALTLEVEQMRVKVQRAEDRGKEVAQAKKQVEEKRRDYIAASGSVGMEFELKPDNQTLVLTDLSPGIAELHETTLDALFGDAGLLFKHVVAADRPRVAEALQLAATEGKRLDVTYGLALPSGAERWIHLRGLPRKTPQNWTRFTALVRDATEEYRAGEGIAKQARLQRVLEALAQADAAPLLGIDRAAKDQVVYVNAAACAHFGFSAEELLQVQIGNLDAGFADAVKAVPPEEAVFTLPGSHETADGTVAVSVDYRRCGDGRLLAARVRRA